jgi:hypothetical protein
MEKEGRYCERREARVQPARQPPMMMKSAEVGRPDNGISVNVDVTSPGKGYVNESKIKRSKAFEFYTSTKRV